MLLIKPNQT